jgi:signal transduction histidine kinase
MSSPTGINASSPLRLPASLPWFRRWLGRKEPLSPQRFAGVHELVDSLDDVFWVYEPHLRRFVYVSDAYESRWLQSRSTLFADADAWLSRVHVDDRPALQMARHGLCNSKGYSTEYRWSARSGAWRWIAEKVVPVRAQHEGAARFAGCSQDITARKALELDLVGAIARRDEFLATLSHELRNPLQPIRTAAALLARPDGRTAEVEARAVAVIERQTAHLSRLVEELLDVSRIRHGKLTLRLEPVLLEWVVDAAVEANLAFLQARGLHLNVEVPLNRWCICGDGVRLTQVFTNLLHNACKFSTPGGTIDLRADACDGDGTVEVRVRDEGAGMTPSIIESLFDIFEQEAQPPTSGDRGGLGIGLSVVRTLVELHGGSVSARSAGRNQGSEFTVTLPCTAAPAVAHDSVDTPRARVHGSP